MKIDLHLHTTASDGHFTPEEIINLAVKKRLDIIAITDHDSIAGITPAMAASQASPWLTVIPGVEINTDVPQGEIHILGYFIDYTNPELNATLQRLRSSRKERALKMVARLHTLGLPLEWKRIQELAQGGSIGRPHIAQALLEKGYIGSIKEAFTKYIGRDGPAYVERKKITPTDAVKLIIIACGLPVLAHPAGINNLEETIIQLKAAGLVGIEVYYDNYTTEAMKALMTVAEKHELIATGGSDYHGLESTETYPGGVTVPVTAVEQLFHLSGKSLELMKR